MKVGPRPTVSIVGAGRLGTALALALSSCDYPVEALVARHLNTARRAARLDRQQPLALSAAQLAKLPSSRVILITTPDDLVAPTADRLAGFQTGRGRTILHTSGALSSDVLSPLAEVGFDVGSMHPLISVSDPVSGAARLRGAFYCLEGDRAAGRVARALVNDLGGQSFSIPSKHKALYHSAAVMASGHLIALIDIATEMLVRCGLDRKNARQVLMPLIQSAVLNLSCSEPERALTGTFARGDLATIVEHLKALRADGLPEALLAYKLLGRRSLELAGRRGTDARVLKRIAQALKRAN